MVFLNDIITVNLVSFFVPQFYFYDLLVERLLLTLCCSFFSPCIFCQHKFQQIERHNSNGWHPD